MDGKVSLSITLIQTEISYIGWIVMIFCKDIHGPQKLNPNDFDDPLTISLAPPAG